MNLEQTCFTELQNKMPAWNPEKQVNILDFRDKSGMREVNKWFCKLKAKAISFCGLQELLRRIQTTFLEVKLPKWGLFSYSL